MAQDPNSGDYLDDLARRAYASGFGEPTKPSGPVDLDELARRVVEREQKIQSSFSRVREFEPEVTLGDRLGEILPAFAGGAIEAQAGASLGADMEEHMSFMEEWNRAAKDAQQAAEEELRGVPWYEQTRASSAVSDKPVALRDPRFMTEEELAAEEAELAAIEQGQQRLSIAANEKFKQFVVDRGLMARQQQYLRDVNEQRRLDGKPQLGDFDLVPTKEWFDTRVKFAAEAADIVNRDQRLQGSLFSTIPSAIGSSVPIMAEAAAASAIAAPIGGVAGAVLRRPARLLKIYGSGATEAIVGTASRLSAAQSGSMMQMSSAYQEAMEFTKGDHGKALEYAMATKPAGFLEAVPIGEQMARAFGRVNRHTGGRFWEYLKRSETLKQLALEGAAEGGEEVIQEGLQAAWQEEAKRAILAEPQYIPVWKKFLAEGAIPAFFSGFLVSVLSTGAAQYRARRGAGAAPAEEVLPTEAEVSAEAAKLEEEAAPKEEAAPEAEVTPTFAPPLEVKPIFAPPLEAAPKVAPEIKVAPTDLVSPEEAADLIGVSTTELVGMVNDGSIRPRGTSGDGRMMFSKAEAEALRPAEIPEGGPAGVTDEAAELIKTVDEGGGVPAMITKRLEKIAEDNGVTVTGSMTPQDVVDILRAKQAAPELEAPVAAEPPAVPTAKPPQPVAAKPQVVSAAKPMRPVSARQFPATPINRKSVGQMPSAQIQSLLSSPLSEGEYDLLRQQAQRRGLAVPERIAPQPVVEPTVQPAAPAAPVAVEPAPLVEEAPAEPPSMPQPAAPKRPSDMTDEDISSALSNIGALSKQDADDLVFEAEMRGIPMPSGPASQPSAPQAAPVALEAKPPKEMTDAEIIEAMDREESDPLLTDDEVDALYNEARRRNLPIPGAEEVLKELEEEERLDKEDALRRLKRVQGMTDRGLAAALRNADRLSEEDASDVIAEAQRRGITVPSTPTGQALTPKPMPVVTAKPEPTPEAQGEALDAIDEPPPPDAPPADAPTVVPVEKLPEEQPKPAAAKPKEALLGSSKGDAALKSMRLSYTVIGDSVAFSGNGTFDNRQRLKSYGARWNESSKSWVMGRDEAEAFVADAYAENKVDTSTQDALNKGDAPKPTVNGMPKLSRDDTVARAQAIAKTMGIVTTANDESGLIRMDGDTKEYAKELGLSGAIKDDGDETTWRISKEGFVKFIEQVQSDAEKARTVQIAERNRLFSAQRERHGGSTLEGTGAGGLRRPAEEIVSEETRGLLKRGLSLGIPAEIVDSQIEDVAKIVQAKEDGKRVFILALEPGSGKTFVLGAAIRELRNRGAKRVIYVTNSQTLVNQIKQDLSAYGIEGVEFVTYPTVRESKKSGEFQSSDVLIFDEAHNVKNIYGSEKSEQGVAAQQWIARTEMTIFSTATPFENPTQAKYLNNTGIFYSAGGWSKWVQLFGGKPSSAKGKGDEPEYMWQRGPHSNEDARAAQSWFVGEGVFSTRPIKLPPNLVDARMVSVDPTAMGEVGEYESRVFNDISKAWADLLEAEDNDELSPLVGLPMDSGGPARMWMMNFKKRIVEVSKIEVAIAEAEKAIERGRYPIIFVETKSERDIDIGNMLELESEYLSMFGDGGKDAPSREEWVKEINEDRKKDAEAAGSEQYKEAYLPSYQICRVLEVYRHNTKSNFITIPSSEKIVQDRLKKYGVSVFSGTFSQAVADKNLEDWRSGKNKVLVATMAKGGTGLSLHDKVGDHPTTQIVLTMPWTATKVKQVAQRNARYGLASKAEILWLYVGGNPLERSLAAKVGGRMADMGATVYGDVPRDADRLTEFNVDDSLFEGENEGDVAGMSLEVLIEPTSDKPKLAPTPSPDEWGPEKPRGLVGIDATIYLADEKRTTINGEYEFVEIGDIIPSHDPKVGGFPKRPGGDINERAYHEPIVGKPEREKVYRAAEEARTDFFTANNPTATDGPPIVAPDGRILGGNGRAMAVELAYHLQGPQSETFRNAFVAAAGMYGVDAEAVRKMRQPILIRRISFKAAGKPGELSAVLNKDHAAKKKKSVEFASKGSKIDRKAIEKISAIIGDRTLSAALESDSDRSEIFQALVKCGAFTTNELVTLSESSSGNEVGPLTAEGTEMLAGSLLGSVITDPGVIQIMPADMRSKVIKLLPAMVRTRMAWGDFSRIVSDTIKIINRKRSLPRSKRIEESLAQQSFDAEGYSEPWLDNTRAIWLAIAIEDGKLESFRSAMNIVGDAARDILEGQTSIFGAGAAVDATFDDVFAPKKGRSAPPREASPVKVATAFSGAGTLEWALVGVESKMAVEYDAELMSAYNAGHGTTYTAADATKIDPKDVAASGAVYFHASPVCKNFSTAKKNRAPTDLDVRSAQSVARVITEARPPIVTVENVPAYAKTEMFKDITDALTSAGYTWRVVQLNAAELGAAQSRSRIVVQAVLNGPLPPLPQRRAPGDWIEAVGDLIDSAPDSQVPAGEMALIKKAAKQGRIDMSKPIITMGGNKAFANAGGPAPALLSSPNMVPRIIMPDGRQKRVTPKMMLRLMGLPDSVKLPSDARIAKKVLGNGIHGEVTRQLIQPLLDGYATRQADGRMAPTPERSQGAQGTRADGWLGASFGTAPVESRKVGNLLSNIAVEDKSGYGALAGAMLNTQATPLEQPFIIKQTGREFAPYDISQPVEFLASSPTSFVLHEVAHVLTMNALSSELRDVPDRMERGDYARVIERVRASGNAASSEAIAKSTSKERADLLRDGAAQIVDAYSAAWSEYVKEFGERATHSNGLTTVERSRLQGGQLNSELSLRYSGPFNYAMSNVEEFVAAANTDKRFQEWLNSKKFSGSKGKFTSIWKAFVDAVAKILGVSVNQGSILQAVLQATEQVSVAQGTKPITGAQKEAPSAAQEGKQPQGGVEQRPQTGERGEAPEAGRGDSPVAGPTREAKPPVEKRRPENTPSGTINNPPTELPPLSAGDVPSPLSPVIPADPAFDLESFPEPDPESIGIANARMIEQLKKIGIDADWERMTVSDLSIWGEVMRDYERDPRTGTALVAELKDNPRPTNSRETAILAYEATYRFNQRDFMYGEVERDPSDANKARLEEAEAALREMWDVTNRVGTESGRAFRLRRLMVKRDYSLDVMQSRARAVLADARDAMTAEAYQAELARAMKDAEERYNKLVASERALAREQQKAEDDFKIKSLEAEIAGLVEEAKKNVARAQAPTAAPAKPAAPKPAKKEEAAKPSEAGKATADLRSKVAFLAQALAMEARAKGRSAPGKSTQEEFDEAMIAYAADRRSAGLTLKEWSDEVLPAVGDQYAPKLRSYWVKSIQSQVQAMHSDVAEIFGSYESKSVDLLSTADKRNLRGKARAYARLFIEEQLEYAGNVPSTGEVIDFVTVSLQQTIPDIGKELTMEIVSGYGDYTPATKDDIELKLSAVIGESREAKKLADVARGVSPKLTGKGRPKPTDEERRLTQTWRRLAKQLGLNAVTQYNVKGAQDAIKSRLTNEIADYEAAIAARTERIAKGTRAIDDPEIQALREKLKEVRQKHDIMFAEDIEVRDLERRVAAKKKEIEGPDEIRERKEFVPAGERSKKLYEELKGLQEQLAELRKNDPVRMMRRLQARTLQLIEEKKKRIEARDFKKAPKRTRAQIEADLRAKAEERQRLAASNPEYAAMLAELDELNTQAELIREELNPKPSEEEVQARGLERRVAEKKKELGAPDKIQPRKEFVPTGEQSKKLYEELKDLQRQLAERRKLNPERIAQGLERRIAEKQKELSEPDVIKPRKEFVPPNAAVAKLYEDLRALQAQLAERRKNDPARRMRRLEAYTRLLIQKKKQRIAARDFKKAPKRTPAQIEADLNAKIEERRKLAASNPEYAAMLAELEELNAQAEAISAELNPKLTPEERAIRQYLARKAKELRKWHEIAGQVMATGKEWLPAPRVKRELTTAEQDAMIAVDKAKAEVMALNDDIERRNRTFLQQVGAVIGQSSEISGAIKSAADFSAVLTQGAFLTYANPIKGALTHWGPYMLRASVDEQFYQRQMLGLKLWASKYFPDLELGDVDGSLTGAETIIRSKLIERIPYIGQTVRGSNRAFMLYLNMQRVWAAKTILNSSPVPLSSDETANLTAFINVASGRGETKELDQAMVRALGKKNKRFATNVVQFAGLALWAPKLYLSRLQLVLAPARLALPQSVVKGNTMRARKEIIKMFARSVLGYLALKSLASMLAMIFDEEDDLEFWDDPRSSNFLKIRFGDKVIDVLGGISQFTTLIARMTTGETIQGRKVRPLREDVAFGMTDAQDTFVNFFRAKLSPINQFYATVATGKDAIGQEASLADALQSLFSPITPSEIAETALEEGVGEALLQAPLQAIGGRIQEYR